MEIEPRFISLKQVAFYLGVHFNTARKWLEQKEIKPKGILEQKLTFDFNEIKEALEESEGARTKAKVKTQKLKIK